MIILEDYNPMWLTLYSQEKEKILSAIPRQSIEAIEHVGSTAVPGLKAKPTIDICIGMNLLVQCNADFINSLQSIGYQYLPELEHFIPERRYLQKLTKDGTHLVHIHIVEFNGKLWKEYIGFRYLRVLR